MQATTAVKRALERVFGPSIGSRKERKEIISKAVILASEDPGQWAPRAKVIVRTETGIPSAAHYVEAIEMWVKVDELVQSYGHDLWSETINGAVTAFYEAT
jgi:hypothetical protein